MAYSYIYHARVTLAATGLIIPILVNPVNTRIVGVLAGINSAFNPAQTLTEIELAVYNGEVIVLD
jgi:hypothetical protein